MAVDVAHSPLVTFAVGLAVVVLLSVVWDFPAFVGSTIAALSVGLVDAVFVPDSDSPRRRREPRRRSETVWRVSEFPS